MDLESGSILDSRDAATPRPLASTTKIVTALAARELAAPEKRIAIGRAETAFQWKDEARADVLVGEEYSLEELLYALMLPSGADAARAIAAGTVGQEAFVARMNALSSRLALKAHFASPTGLMPDDQADRKSTRLNSSHPSRSRMPSSA